ncbi:PREDICTED: uncharacterized protein LOC108562713 [Nicrophorus vespilloides]|uniref:Uncharacterized protein LOC108562713 n=1 Tax=Nicrophorus vespilloides TaxID=110193 RepID=A0ABM1MPW5_NICVS|nr:PREDICTED: uncharacterized protein LOC108562713 [Nicrophorus vespilloides]
MTAHERDTSGCVHLRLILLQQQVFAAAVICSCSEKKEQQALLQNFKEQRIDGSGLPLLTEDHLTSTMNMKLGPALKLKSVLAKKLGSCSVCLHCSHCHTSNSPESGHTTGNNSDSGGNS